MLRSRPGQQLRRVLLVTAAVALASCGGSPSAVDADVQPIEPILATDITVEPDPSGTVAVLRVETEVPVVCAVVYGTGDQFGAIATDSDMAGGAHRDHAPRLTGLQPETEYQYVLQGSDAAGNLYRSELRTFRTPEVSAAPGRNVAPDATVVDVSSEFSDQFAAPNAIDGDLATEWSTDGDGDDASITVDLGAPTDIVGVRYRTREMTDGSAIVRTFTVTLDDDEPLGPFPADAVAEIEGRGQRLRFEAAETTGGNTGAVEIEVYAADG